MIDVATYLHARVSCRTPLPSGVFREQIDVANASWQETEGRTLSSHPQLSRRLLNDTNREAC